MGLIAQDVEPILPSVVEEIVDLDEKNTTENAECNPFNEDTSTCVNKKLSKSISYTELVPLLISALQEQQKQIDELKSKLS